MQSYKKGSSFSHIENLQFYGILKNPQQEEEDIFLTRNDRMKFRIVVVIRTRIVCSWKIIEVDVDAVNIGDLEIMDEDS
jgi:hypothetical protein